MQASKKESTYLEATLLEVLQLVLFEVQLDLGAPAERLPTVTSDREAAACLRLPDVLHTKQGQADSAYARLGPRQTQQLS